MALFIARWPDGSAWIVNAESMPDVAEILDEVADPGACEVQEYEGPFAIELRPAAQLQNGASFEFCLTDGDTSYEVQAAILKAAFPQLHAACETAREKHDSPEPSDDAWTKAMAREIARDLNPSSEWAESVRDWWEARTGVPADRSAALRDMHDVTIPGEPKIETPEQRELFRRTQRKITQRVADMLRTPTPKTPRRPPGTSRPSSRSRKKP